MDASTTSVRFLSDPAPYERQESLYLRVRELEGRVLPDDAVRTLPFYSGTGRQAKEWHMRRRSFERLARYLGNKYAAEARLQILDLGCGNGWMSGRLSQKLNVEIWAVDLNRHELEQGARLFGSAGVQFFYADILKDTLPEHHFDLAILGASVQYFSDLETLIFMLKRSLKPGGEIHLIDSPFYRDNKSRKAASQRSAAYYATMGVPEMAGFYHHHLLGDVLRLGGKDMNRAPVTRLQQKLGWLAPFPWIVVKNG
ncbi:MAG: class I SAM-dependent methyltransferase [Saprospiraceae bacterium]|nr:class I SAM-dependent methyltransferase [Saprospiraceae bacterium]MCB9305551.1 class I SAM-dependent methyltransferase [Lewinellaceae bacterium]MCB9355053.1 class I SAM-dependent methyltransferase [Lewinellaceae bacterium]